MKSTERFSDRVEHYVKYRPGYPVDVLAFLRDAIGMTPGWVVADVGAGTGISSELLLANGNEVYAVEPNEAMRGAAEKRLGGNPKFHSVKGTATETALADRSVDVVTAWQAFHWFEPVATRKELERILRPPGWVVLVWNERKTKGSAFLEAYEELLIRYGTDYQKIRHDNLSDSEFAAFFGAAGYENRAFENEQRFGFEGVKGRLLSSSYVPGAGDPRHGAMLDELRGIFDKYQEAGIVRFEYVTRLYYGQVHIA